MSGYADSAHHTTKGCSTHLDMANGGAGRGNRTLVFSLEGFSYKVFRIQGLAGENSIHLLFITSYWRH
jgi:hypothetical protein